MEIPVAEGLASVPETPLCERKVFSYNRVEALQS